MEKKSYQDFDFHDIMLKSKQRFKATFYIWLFCAIVCLSITAYVLLTDSELTGADYIFVSFCDAVIIACLIALGLSYRSIKRDLKNYENTIINKPQKQK